MARSFEQAKRAARSAALLFLFVGLPARAAPTLAETLAWLREKIDAHASWIAKDPDPQTRYQSVRTSVTSAEHCALVLRVERYEELTPHRKRTVVTETTLPLGKLDPARTSVRQDTRRSVARVQVGVAGGRKEIESTISGDDATTRAFADTASFEIDDDALAARVVRALHHAIALCRGRTVSAPSEPF